MRDQLIVDDTRRAHRAVGVDQHPVHMEDDDT